MAINFPSSPAEGEEYTDPNSGTWVYDSGTNSWTLTAGGSTSAFNFRGGHDFRSSTPPADPIESGDMWIHDAPDGTVDGVYTGISGQIANGQLVLWDGNSYVMVSGTLPGYPDVGDGEGGTLDSRYLKLGANAGDQTVQSTGRTTFNGRGEFGGGVKVTGGIESSVVNGIGSSTFGDQRLFAFAGGDTVAQFAFDGTTVLGFDGVAVNRDPLTIRSDTSASVAGGSNLINFQGKNSSNVFSTFGKFGTVLQENAGAGGGIAKFAFELDSGGGTVEKAYVGASENFFVNDTYIGGTATRNTRQLWESTLTEEQKEQLSAGTLAIPANVSTPGDGSFVRQWWYDQQSAEDQALIDSGELEYPSHFQAANFVDTFDLGDNTQIDFITGSGSRSGTAALKGIYFKTSGSSDSVLGRGIVYSNTNDALLSVNTPSSDDSDITVFLGRGDCRDYSAWDGTISSIRPRNADEVTSFKAATPLTGAQDGEFKSYRGFSLPVPTFTKWTGEDNVYGFYSNVPNATKPDKPGQTYGFYAEGTAPNYFKGNIDCDGLINGAFSLRMETDDPAAFQTTYSTDEEGNQVERQEYIGTTEDLLAIIKDLRARVAALEAG